MLPFLTDDEIFSMVKPLTQKKAIVRWCVSQGIPHRVKPNGMPLISRNISFEAHQQTENHQSEKPDISALLDKFRKEVKNGGNGAETKKQSARAA